MDVSIHMSAAMHADILLHLFPKGDRREQGGFLFCSYDDETQIFNVREWLPLTSSDYASQERDYLELCDTTRASLIKKAHDMDAALVEIHCHPGQQKVAFSLADWMGFKDFVPHIRWRLKGRPYAALVYGYQCIDGFAWIDQQKLPINVTGINTGQAFHSTTGNSMNALSRGFYEKI
ncbi:MAG: hypothetical protein BVN34_09080 [Proteobacteria bacterium ST_bin12]|nr:MAG: hypothetical protein BVN34_09080 [Proteobacteria bacterium ST_bin12]